MMFHGLHLNKSTGSMSCIIALRYVLKNHINTYHRNLLDVLNAK